MNPTGIVMEVAGIYFLIDSCISIGVRVDEFSMEMPKGRWLEFIARGIRGLLGVTMILIG